MIADVSKESQSRGRSQVTKRPTDTRKRKDSLETPREGVKRRSQTRERPDPAEKRSGESSASVDPPRKHDEKYYNFTVRRRPLNQLGANRQWQCDRCDEGEKDCMVDPLGPCRRCKRRKQGCSLMPRNTETNKTTRRKMTIDEIFNDRTKELKKRRKKEAKAAKKLEGRAHSPHDASKPENPLLAPSPSEPLSGLGSLTPESAGSLSAANTPTDSPATVPPLPEHPAPAPLKVPKPRKSTKRSASKPTFKALVTASAQHLTAFAVVVPTLEQLHKHRRRQASPPPSGASPESGDGKAARFAAIERRLDALEKLAQQASPLPNSASPASGGTSNGARFAAIEKRLDALEKSAHAQIPS